jgi:hypothetical protein
LHVFDRRIKDHTADYLRQIARTYQLFDDGSADIDDAARAINGTNLDVLINIDHDLPAYKVLDLLDTPCIVHLCSGTDLLHHDKVSFQIHAQPEAEFFIQDGRMFCTFTRQPFSQQRLYPGMVIYDIRDIAQDRAPLWMERKPLIFWHGSIYKLAKRPLLDIILRLLAEDSSLDFIFMGRDDLQREASLPFIEKHSSEYGVSARVHYAGQMLVGRRPDGEVFSDQGWSEIKKYLSETRLWPNTFPVGGGAARVEAYASGAPSIHMGVRFDPPYWGVSQPGTAELPALLVPEGTAYSVQEYESLCRRCIYDEAYANSLIQIQLGVSERSTNGEAFWKQMREFYQDWLANQTQPERILCQ